MPPAATPRENATLVQRIGELPKTIELIRVNIHVDAVRGDLDTQVMDEELLEGVIGYPDPAKKAREISVT